VALEAEAPGGGTQAPAFAESFAPAEEAQAPQGLGGIAILRPLRIRSFALLWAGMTVSLIGDGIYFVAIPFQVFEISNAATALSAVGAAFAVPQVVFLLLGGIVTDRFDRRRVLIASDITRGVSIGLIGLLSLAGELGLGILVVLAAVYGVGEAFFMPAFGAIVPDVVPSDLLVEANSLDQLVRPLAYRLAGPVIGGLLIATPFGVGGALLLDAWTFAFSAGALFVLRVPPRTETAVREPASALAELREGFRFVRSRTWLWGGFVASGVGLLAFYGPWQVLVPYVIKNGLGGNAGDFGLVLAAGGAGSILTSALVGQRGLTRRPVIFVFGAWATCTLLLAGFALATTTWHAMVVGFLLLGLLTGGQIVWGTLLHKFVPRELLGRVSSLDWLVSTSLIPLSFAFAGPVGEALGAEATLVAAALLGSCAMLLCLLLPGMTQLGPEVAAPREAG
jgi:MFS family permease